jgi:hypothetical protein|tara:strand:- start:727 stop:1224 length:498 start_codon:yes stop_codon:yes gene_type:complete
MVISTEFKKRGPLFSQTLEFAITSAMREGMKGAVLTGEASIKKLLVRQPRPYTFGGRKKGNLARGISGRVQSATRGVITPSRNTPYAKLVEYGRAASQQEIKPRRARALRFKPRGGRQFIYRASARPFVRKMTGNPTFKKTAQYFRSSRSPLPKIFRNALLKALR